MRFSYHRVTAIPIQLVEQELEGVLADFADSFGLVLNPTDDRTTFSLTPAKLNGKKKFLRDGWGKKMNIEALPKSPLGKSRLYLTIAPHPEGTELYCDGFLDLDGILRAYADEPESPELKKKSFLKRYPIKAKLYATRQFEHQLTKVLLTLFLRKEVPRRLDEMFDSFEADYRRYGPERFIA